jgi:hypothetical protein
MCGPSYETRAKMNLISGGKPRRGEGAAARRAAARIRTLGV